MQEAAPGRRDDQSNARSKPEIRSRPDRSPLMARQPGPAGASGAGDNALTASVELRRVVLVANTASGSVGPRAPAEAREILDSFGIDTQIYAAEPGGDNIMDCLDKAFADRPDLVLAGDGTARAAAERAGMKGPLIAPLPGGTMNMLPHAVYGEVNWQVALRAVLQQGEARTLGGGTVEGHTFFVAAVLGAPALWAGVREAMREGDHRKAMIRATGALRRAFTGRLRYRLSGGLNGKAEALSLLCPLISQELDDDEHVLEAAAIDPHNAAQAFRLAFHAVADDWRNDPAVVVGRCKSGRVWASGRIPAILDGEPVRLGSSARIAYNRNACRILAPPRQLERTSPLDLFRRRTTGPAAA
jgi:diacylglycerol kinase family enzyme